MQSAHCTPLCGAREGKVDCYETKDLSRNASFVRSGHSGCTLGFVENTKCCILPYAIHLYATFVLMSSKPKKQPEWSPCTRRTVERKRNIKRLTPWRCKSLFRNRGSSASGSDAAVPADADAAVVRQTCSYREERKNDKILMIYIT